MSITLPLTETATKEIVSLSTIMFPETTVTETIESPLVAATVFVSTFLIHESIKLFGEIEDIIHTYLGLVIVFTIVIIVKAFVLEKQ